MIFFLCLTFYFYFKSFPFFSLCTHFFFLFLFYLISFFSPSFFLPAAAGWPLSELWHKEIANVIGLDSILVGKYVQYVRAQVCHAYIISYLFVAHIFLPLQSFFRSFIHTFSHPIFLSSFLFFYLFFLFYLYSFFLSFNDTLPSSHLLYLLFTFCH